MPITIVQELGPWDLANVAVKVPAVGVLMAVTVTVSWLAPVSTTSTVPTAMPVMLAGVTTTDGPGATLVVDVVLKGVPAAVGMFPVGDVVAPSKLSWCDPVYVASVVLMRSF